MCPSAPVVERSPAHVGGIQCRSNMREEKPEMQAYCVKCRGQQEIKDPKSITMANGRPAVQGTCPACGTKLTRIVKKSE